MPVATLYIEHDWHKTEDGRDRLSQLLRNNKRHPFGLLEKPKFAHGPSHFDEYKLFLAGKSNVGKTSLAAKLSGNAVPVEHWPTPGIQISTVYWPAKHQQSGEVLGFKLQLWDVGEGAIKKFVHLLPACQKDADGVIFVFSAEDKSSYDDLVHGQMARMLPERDLCRFVVETKLDKPVNDVTKSDRDSYEATAELKLFNVGDMFKTSTNVADLDDIVPLLNHICDQLYFRRHVMQARPD